MGGYILVLTRRTPQGPRVLRTEPGIRLGRTGIIRCNTALVDKVHLPQRYRVELSAGRVTLAPDPEGFSMSRMKGKGMAALSVGGRHLDSPVPFDDRFLPAEVLEDGTIVATVEETP